MSNNVHTSCSAVNKGGSTGDVVSKGPRERIVLATTSSERALRAGVQVRAVTAVRNLLQRCDVFSCPTELGWSGTSSFCRRIRVVGCYGETFIQWVNIFYMLWLLTADWAMLLTVITDWLTNSRNLFHLHIEITHGKGRH